MRFALAVVLAALLSTTAGAYSVLGHEATVDSAWTDAIRPLLKQRFPRATDADIQKARAYAYGGSVIQDLGYYPSGSRFFSDLVHYVRSGDFVEALIDEAHDVNEYAFALGALAHWVADTTGHPEATNRIVPELYPKLRKKFGDEVTYADDHTSHLETEFRFDVFQMARTKGGRDIFHHALQFEIATRALDEAFQKTYGVRLDDLFTSTDAAILTYRWAFRGLIHEVTGIAWELYRADIQKLDPEMTPAGFVYDLSRADFEREFGHVFMEPGYFAKFFALLVKLVPDVGPLERSVVKPLPSDARARYDAALEHAVSRYRSAVQSATAQRLDLPERNLDTAQPIRFGDYAPADEAYADLTAKLAKHDPDAVPVAMRRDLARFYANRAPGERNEKDRALDDHLARLACGPDAAARP